METWNEEMKCIVFNSIYVHIILIHYYFIRLWMEIYNLWMKKEKNNPTAICIRRHEFASIPTKAKQSIPFIYLWN